MDEGKTRQPSAVHFTRSLIGRCRRSCWRWERLWERMLPATVPGFQAGRAALRARTDPQIFTMHSAGGLKEGHCGLQLCARC